MFRCYFRGDGMDLYYILCWVYRKSMWRDIYSEREFKVKMLEGLRYELSIYNVCADEGGFIHLNILV